MQTELSSNSLKAGPGLYNQNLLKRLAANSPRLACNIEVKSMPRLQVWKKMADKPNMENDVPLYPYLSDIEHAAAEKHLASSSVDGLLMKHG